MFKNILIENEDWDEDHINMPKIELEGIFYHGSTMYDDIAIFNPSFMRIKDVKLLIDDYWTDYMSLGEAQELIDEEE